jgi:hypothetical protein
MYYFFYNLPEWEHANINFCYNYFLSLALL